MAFLTSSSTIHRLLLASAVAWSLSASIGKASLGETPLPKLIIELQGMSADEREETFRHIGEEMASATAQKKEQKRQWLKSQWAALSPDQRGQLRNQIRDHWQHMPPEQRQSLREERRAEYRSDYGNTGAGRQDEYRQQRLSPDERQEFRQWMRDRRGDDSNGGLGGTGGFSGRHGPP